MIPISARRVCCMIVIMIVIVIVRAVRSLLFRPSHHGFELTPQSLDAGKLVPYLCVSHTSITPKRKPRGACHNAVRRRTRTSRGMKSKVMYVPR
jgi:hypothetical protein